MKRIWNYVIATLLCAGGCCAYYFNPYRKGSLVVGFILQLFCSILIFANISENETTTADFRSIAKETKEQNIYWLVGSLFVDGSAAAIVLNGVEFGIFRFGLLVIMWGGLFMLSKYIGYFSWRSRNKETVQQLAAEGIAQRKAEREKTKQEEQAEQQSVQKAKEQQEALALNVKQLEDAFNAQVANTVKTRQRVQESPDLFILSQLSNGDEAGLQEALNKPSVFSLASIEAAIMQRSSNKEPIFYRLSGQVITTQKEMDEAQSMLLYLARSYRLLENPAFSQYLIARCGSFGGQRLLQMMAAQGAQTLFAFQLLGVHMQVAFKVFGRLG